ncbi:MAG: histidine kinase [Flavobacteriales bacterium]|nr:histidine kinase [Flavobacteriales bacterium]HPF90351.1 two-component regulator propeller domain-containing protein [Flavobacteriales bacterium]
MSRAILVAALTALLPLAALAQQHSFKQHATKDGLAQSQVRAMMQDAQGYLWFGTLGGASRFDGQEFTSYALSDGLPDLQVSAIVRDHAGTLLFAAGNAIATWNGKGFTAEPLPAASKGARILAMVTSGDRLFVGTDGGGVFVRTTTGISTLEGYPSDTATHVRSLALLRDGRLLIGLRSGLLVWDNGSCKEVVVGDAEAKAVNALAEGTDGSWWVGTVIDGLFRIRPDGTTEVYDEENGLLRNNVRCLFVDDRDRLWIGTKFGLNLLENGRLKVFTVHQGLPNDNIWCAYQDAEGGLWFGTDGAGALQYAGDRFITFTQRDGICSDLVMNITADARGDLWLGTYDNGICRMDGMAMVTTLDGLPNNTIWSGMRDRNGNLWFGTSAGPVLLVNGIVQPLPAELLVHEQPVLSLDEGPDGTIWFGMREGLLGMRPDRTVVYHASGPDGPGRSIRSMWHDRYGHLWMATDNGLVRKADGAFARWTTAEGLSDNTVQCLLPDSKGRLWIGTANGLSCMDGGVFQRIRLAGDLGSNYLDLLVDDGAGRIWAGTNNGLYAFEPDSLLKRSTAAEHITLNDGLRGLEFNLNAAGLARGKLLLGSSAGLVYHDLQSDRHERDASPPPARITAIRSFLQPTDWSTRSRGTDADGLPVGLQLDHRRNHLTFDYLAISLREPDKVIYRYRLVGFDQDWLPPTDARFASYSNLSHGQYAFEVIASTGDGRWSAPASVEFEILPPFWSRWWFYALCALALIGIATAILRYRTLRRERRERTRQLLLRSRMLQLEQQSLNANMNRHFVFNALNSIQYHINKQDRSTASRYLTSFAKLIRKNLDASQLDTTTLAEELERLELYLQLEHMRFKDKFEYRIEVEPGLNVSEAKLPAMMLQPYVENSIWHGILPMEGTGTVRIEVSRAPEDRIEVRVLDNGIGFQQSMDNKANAGDHISRGIEITKGRADVLRRLDLTDIRITGPADRLDPGTGRSLGTQVLVSLPMANGWKKDAEGLRSAQERSTFGVV